MPRSDFFLVLFVLQLSFYTGPNRVLVTLRYLIGLTSLPDPVPPSYPSLSLD